MPEAPRLKLSTDNVVSYLIDRGLLPRGAAVRARELSGGISNAVIRVDSAQGSLVVKQSLPALRVAELWEFDPTRILIERDCMDVLGRLLAPGSVPEVLDSDEVALAFAMSCAPEGGVVWKDALLRGEIDLMVARRAGILLGQVHGLSAAQPSVAERFADVWPLVQGRTDPYHQTTARAHPDLAPLIEADVERLLSQRRTLVLGDYSPKNLIVYPGHILALDFEVAHWGDPAFDAAFMLTHLVAKAIHRPVQRDEYISAARVFWDAYVGAAGDHAAREADVVSELAVLLLCRVDGKSKLEYLSDAESRAVRAFGRDVLTGVDRSLAVLDAVGAAAVPADVAVTGRS